MKEFDCDVVILGGGSAGYAAARTAAGAGLKTAVIEGGGKSAGCASCAGACPPRRCFTPRKSSTWPATPGPGASGQKRKLRFRQGHGAQERPHQGFADFRRQQLAGGRFKFIRANARFLDAHTVKLNNPPADASAPSSSNKNRATHVYNTSQRNTSSSPPAQSSRPRPCPNSMRPVSSPAMMRWRQAVAEVAHRPGRRGDCVRIRPIFRAVRGQGHAHPAQRAHSEGVRHRRRN